MQPRNQQNQYQQDSDYPDAYNDSTTYERPDKEYLREQIDVSEQLEDFEHRVLRGEYWIINKDTGEGSWDKLVPDADPIINERGVRELMARIIGRVTKAAKLSYKTEEEIYKDMFYFDMSITELIAKRSGLWQLDIETAKAIKDSAVELVWDIVASSRDGFTAINLRSQYSKQDISRTETEGAKQKTFLGIPIGGKR